MLNRYRITTRTDGGTTKTHEVEAHSAADAVTQVETVLKKQKPRTEYFDSVEPIHASVRAKQDFITAAIARPGPDPVTTKLNPGSGPL